MTMSILQLTILDCCHSGGMDREQPQEGERVRGIRDNPNVNPLPRTLDQEILYPAPSDRAPMVSLVPPAILPYKMRAAHVTLAACNSLQKAKESSCTFIPAVGCTPVTQVRGVFSVNLISMLRALGRDGIKGWSYWRLMDELVRRGSYSEGLPRLSSQNPECKGPHKNRAFFGKGGTVDVPDSFTLTKDGKSWSVQAGHVHGVIPGTEFVLTQTAIQRMGYRGEDVILRAVSVEALQCRVQSLSYPLPDSLDHLRVSVLRWGDAHPFTTKVSVRGAEAISRGTSVANTASADELYYQWVSDTSPHCDILVDISQQSGTVSRIERRDPLSATFCNSTRLACVPTEGTSVLSARVLNSISRFNFHLYRLNTAEGIDNYLKVTVLFHVVERILAESSKYRVRPDMDPVVHYGDVPVLDAAISIAKHRRGDSLHRPEVSGGAGSNLAVSKLVKKVVLKPLDKHFHGFTLVNDSEVDLFPYVFYFNPDTYAITVRPSGSYILTVF